jgi:glycogen(starch) synthase
VRFCGRVPPGQVPLYYYLADVGVDPVHDDDAARGRSPLKLFESWVCGVPFVTADVGDRRLLLGDPPAGMLARPGDAGALAQAILAVLENPDLSQTLRQRGLARVPDYYWDHLAEELDGIYRKFLGGIS